MQRQRQQRLGAIVVRVSRGEIRRVDYEQWLAGLDLFTKRDLQLRHAAGERRRHLDQVGRIGFDDGRQRQVARNLACDHRCDDKLAAQWRSLGHRDGVVRTNQRHRFRRRLGMPGGAAEETIDCDRREQHRHERGQALGSRWSRARAAAVSVFRRTRKGRIIRTGGLGMGIDEHVTSRPNGFGKAYAQTRWFDAMPGLTVLGRALRSECRQARPALGGGWCAGLE